MQYPQVYLLDIVVGFERALFSPLESEAFQDVYLHC